MSFCLKNNAPHEKIYMKEKKFYIKKICLFLFVSNHYSFFYTFLFLIIVVFYSMKYSSNKK
jgi:hypothetical protein